MHDHTAPPPQPASDAAQDRRERYRSALVVGVAVGVVAAAGVVAATTIGTARARFSASTSNTGSVFSTAVVDLRLEGSSSTTVALSVDATGMTPVDVVERCVTVRYSGSLDDAGIRLSGRRDGGTGLERFMASTVETGTGADVECTDFTPSATVFDGTLLELWEQPDPIVLADDLADGSATTVRLTFRLVDDNRAQGLDTAFWLVFEARP